MCKKSRKAITTTWSLPHHNHQSIIPIQETGLFETLPFSVLYNWKCLGVTTSHSGIIQDDDDNGDIVAVVAAHQLIRGPVLDSSAMKENTLSIFTPNTIPSTPQLFNLQPVPVLRCMNIEQVYCVTLCRTMCVWQ